MLGLTSHGKRGMGKFVREGNGGRTQPLGVSMPHQRSRNGAPTTSETNTARIELGKLVAAESGDSLISENELAAIAKALTASFESLDAPVELESGSAIPTSTIRNAMESVRVRYLARLDQQQTKRAV